MGARSLTDDVYERLRTAITRGEIRPNERLVEAELAERLAVSRTPVREGLQRLAAEGLVVSRRREWVAREHTPEEIREIYETRAALEGFASRLAAVRATQEQLQRIVSIHRDAEHDPARSPRERLVELNEAFHDAVALAAGNSRLLEQIRRNRQYYFNYRIARLYTDAEAAASIEGHDRLVRALLARDADAAEQATREHILEALDVTLTKLR